MAFTKQFCKACLVPYYYMIPSVFLFCAIGAYGNELDIADLIALVFWSIVGIVMRRYGWPRPPLLVAVVLGAAGAAISLAVGRPLRPGMDDLPERHHHRPADRR